MKLSICIPTWNRAERLRLSLGSIAEQITADGLDGSIEICVSDNGSIDETPSVISALERDFPGVKLRTRRFETNQGFARNMDAVIRLAVGEFAYLHGDDDRFRPNGVSALLEQCATIDRSAVLIRNLWDSAGAIKWDALAPMQRIVFPDAFAALNALGPFHPSFIGNFILRRSEYVKCWKPQFVDSIYPHTAVLLEVLKGRSVEFRNFTCINVDDRDRRVGFGLARGTAVDMARIQTSGLLIQFPMPLRKFAYYRTFLRSIPRAVLYERMGACVKSNSRYCSLSPGNLCDCYRASVPAVIMAMLLMLVARTLPIQVLALCLNVEGTSPVHRSVDH